MGILRDLFMASATIDVRTRFNEASKGTSGIIPGDPERQQFKFIEQVGLYA